MRRRTYLTVLGATLIGGRASTPTWATRGGTTGEGQGEVDVTLEETAFETHETTLGPEYGMRAFVQNTGAEPLTYVEVDAAFYDDEEILLETTLTNIAWLAPGDTWEAWLGFPGSGEDAGVSNGTADVVDYSAHGMVIPDQAELVDHELVEDRDDPTVIGHVENTSDDDPIDYLEAYAAFYDEPDAEAESTPTPTPDPEDDTDERPAGNVVRVDWTNVGPIPSGDTWRFELEYFSTDPAAPEVPDDYAVRLSGSPF